MTSPYTDFLDQFDPATQGFPTHLAQEPLYYASYVANYAAYATPTDLATLRCPAGKRLIVRDTRIVCSATATSVASFFFLVRSTDNVGGTRTTPAIIKRDSAEAAASAIMDVYSAAPAALGTIQRALAEMRTAVTALTNSPAIASLSTTGSAVGQFMSSGLILRPGEMLALNFNGAALPAGFTSMVSFAWQEEDI